jgi:hypothetical protein
MDGGATKTVTDQTTGAEPNYVFGGYKETYGLYEDGKHRRYGLLFSVNGGGFTVGSLFAKAVNAPLLGNLTISQLAIGMAIFTVAMYADILTFGMRFRHMVMTRVRGGTRVFSARLLLGSGVVRLGLGSGVDEV